MVNRAEITAVVPVRVRGDEPFDCEARIKRIASTIPRDVITMLVVDYGSDEKGADSLASWSEAYQFSLVNSLSPGEVFSVGAARDIGVTAADTALIMFHDIDFLMSRENYKKLAGEARLRNMPQAQNAFFVLPGVYLTEEATLRYLALHDGGSGDDADAFVHDAIMNDNCTIFSHMTYAISAVVACRDHLISLGGHNDSFQGHGAEDFELINRLAYYYPKGPRPRKYYENTRTNSVRSFVGFRSYFALYGLDLFQRGLVLSHLYHPKRTDAKYWQNDNQKRVGATMRKFDDGSARPPAPKVFYAGVGTSDSRPQSFPQLRMFVDGADTRLYARPAGLPWHWTFARESTCPLMPRNWNQELTSEQLSSVSAHVRATAALVKKAADLGHYQPSKKWASKRERIVISVSEHAQSSSMSANGSHHRFLQIVQAAIPELAATHDVAICASAADRDMSTKVSRFTSEAFPLLCLDADKIIVFDEPLGLFAAALGKPVMVFGTPRYQHEGITLEGHNKEDLLQFCRSRQRPPSEALNLVQYLLANETSIPSAVDIKPQTEVWFSQIRGLSAEPYASGWAIPSVSLSSPLFASYRTPLWTLPRSKRTLITFDRDGTQRTLPELANNIRMTKRYAVINFLAKPFMPRKWRLEDRLADRIVNGRSTLLSSLKQLFPNL